MSPFLARSMVFTSLAVLLKDDLSAVAGLFPNARCKKVAPARRGRSCTMSRGAARLKTGSPSLLLAKLDDRGM